MKGKIFLFLSIVLILFYLSCSNTPYPDSYYDVEIDWVQYNVIGNAGEEVLCYIEVENTSLFTIYGYVKVEATAFDGSKYSEKQKFSSVGPSSSLQEELEFDVDNKRIIDVEIKEEDFFYK